MSNQKKKNTEKNNKKINKPVLTGKSGGFSKFPKFELPSDSQITPEGTITGGVVFLGGNESEGTLFENSKVIIENDKDSLHSVNNDSEDNNVSLKEGYSEESVEQKTAREKLAEEVR